MSAARSLMPVAAMAVAGALALPAGGAGAQESGRGGPVPQLVVEAPRQVTADSDPTRLYVAPALAVDPGDPSTVVMAVGDARSGGCGLRVSRDGGLSWAATAPTLMPDDLPLCAQRNFGPVMAPAFASDGTLYVGVSGSSAETDPPHPNGPTTALVARTTDLGVTHQTFTAARPEGFVYTPSDGGPALRGFHRWRLPTLAVDPTDPDKVCMGWRLWVGGAELEDIPFGAFPERAYIATSDDGGRSWTEPLDVLRASVDDAAAEELGLVFEGERVTAADTPSLVVGPDGTAYGFTKERPPRAPEGQPDPVSRLFMFRSTDGGGTWETSVVNEGAQRIDSPAAAVDPDSGDLYLAYASRGRSTEEGEAPNPSEVYVTTSTDGGQTWSEPENITDDDPSGGFNQYFPGISVAPGGRVDVAWYDFRNDPFFEPGQAGAMGTAVGERYWDVYYASSADGGQTWSPNTRVTNPSVDGEAGVTFNNQDVRGPVGIASTDQAAYVAWADSRPSSDAGQDAEDAYLSRIRYEAAPDLGATGGGAGESRLLWSLVGAGAALALGGLVLVLGVRRAQGGAPAGATERAGVAPPDAER